MRPEPAAAGSGLRSTAWFGADGRPGMIYRTWMRAEGFTPEVFDGRPVIGIANSWSELTPCNSHLRGIGGGGQARRLAGRRRPARVPHDVAGRADDAADAMLFRNLMAMEVEETLRANPLDGVVLLSGCDKTTPAMLMAAGKRGPPGMLVTGGAKLNGQVPGRGARIGHPPLAVRE